MRIRNTCWFGSALLAMLAAGVPAADAQMAPPLGWTGGSGHSKPVLDVPPAAGTAATLHLANGDYLPGELQNCDDGGKLRWQGSAFAAPLDFPLGAVSAVSFPSSKPQPRSDSPYRLELDGGDVLLGNLVGLTGNEVQLDAPGLGLLHIRRSAVRNILHCRAGSDLIYVGPNSLLEWKESPKSAWVQDAGQLVTTRVGATLLGELGLPDQACVETEISWTSEPDFTLALGASNAPQPGQPDQNGNGQATPKEAGFRLEVLVGQLVLVAEGPQRAEITELQKINSGAGRCHLRIYLDQKQSRAIVMGADGGQLADVTLADAAGPHGRVAEVTLANAASHPGKSVELVNHRGNVRLEQLLIARWDGKPPHAVKGGKSQLRRSDGSVADGGLEGFDPATKEFLLADGDRKSRVPADAVESIALSSSGSMSAFGMRVTCGSGMRLSGNLLKVKDNRLYLSRPGITEPLALELGQLRSLVAMESRKLPPAPKGCRGRLEGDGLKSEGCLVEDGQTPASCLCWHPLGSTSSSPLVPGFSGRIVYREEAPRKLVNDNAEEAPVAQAAGPVLVVGAVINLLARDRSRPTATAPAASIAAKEAAIYLRSGDKIPCEVKHIDERGVAFHSPSFDATLVPHDKIKAIELENQSQGTKIDLSKRDRLLTVPRMQKEDPPTHLIRSTKGDYLRGRLIELEDKSLTVEVRSETRSVPRKQVASIIWLDKIDSKKDSDKKEKTDPPKEPPKQLSKLPAGNSGEKLPPNRVQSRRSDGARLTFQAEQLAGATLRGKSDVLGACRVQLNEIDELIIGRGIQQELSALPYQRWSWLPAIEPKFVQKKGGGESGTDSELVGKPAPDIDLETLAGQRFRLSEHRNQIVVVDFWATWCGPCMQTLPQLVGTVGKFRDKNVVLLAVNMQESPDAIKSMLDRLELKVNVGLDSTGIVAEKYAAVAIPQTVIIDGSGKVARLFVGGGPQYADEVNDALRAILSPAAAQPKPKEGSP